MHRGCVCSVCCAQHCQCVACAVHAVNAQGLHAAHATCAWLWVRPHGPTQGAPSPRGLWLGLGLAILPQTALPSWDPGRWVLQLWGALLGTGMSGAPMSPCEGCGVSWGWGHREGTGPPPPSRSCSPASHLCSSAPARRGERGEHLQPPQDPTERCRVGVSWAMGAGDS